MSGEIVLARLPQEDVQESCSHQHGSARLPAKEHVREGFGPWSLAYAGHQFGHFAGQLGDGRAISILTVLSTQKEIEKAFNLPLNHHSAEIQPKVELQLKGAGRTPFSRFADGLAVLRSSIREYLGTETCAHLPQFPTSRSLSLICFKGIKVEREKIEQGAIVSRLSPSSWLRIGNFELLRWKRDWIGLKKLTNCVVDHVFVFNDDLDDLQRRPVMKLIKEVMIRNAKMVAAWQAWGFMHGVINTDNISILGVTIDFGPFAFMDIYNPRHICNHSDELGRYSYDRQPEMIKFGLRKLGESLAELVGYEVEAQHRSRNKGDDGNPRTFEDITREGDTEELDRFRELGLAAVEEDVLNHFDEVYVTQYHSLMRRRLGLSVKEESDWADIIAPLLNLMVNRLDYSITLRALHNLSLSTESRKFSKESIEHFLEILNQIGTAPTTLAQQGKIQDDSELNLRWLDWILKYQNRILREADLNPLGLGGIQSEESFNQTSAEQNHQKEEESLYKLEVCRKRCILENNPRFVLRQWILEDVISQLEKDVNNEKPLKQIYELMKDPFETGDDPNQKGQVGTENDQESKARFSRLGDSNYLGFQCSCSS